MTTGLPKLTLLLGAHKTGAGHLQETLLAARDPLLAEGIGLIGPADMRQHLRPLWEQGGSPDQAAAVLAQLCPGAWRVVMMEENILGTTARRMLYGPRGALYPFAKGRLQAVLALFPGADLQIGLGLRDQGDHLVACWSDQLMQGHWQPFADYAAGLELKPKWAGTLLRLADVAGHLTLWRHQDHDLILPRIIDWATGFPGLGHVLPPAPRGPSRWPSHQAATVIAGVMAEAPDCDFAMAWRRVRAKWPKGDFPAFHPWSQTETRAFAMAYAADLARIAADPRMDLLIPEDAWPEG